MAISTDKNLKTMGLSIPEDLIPQMDVRARELDLNRSQYIRSLVRADLEKAAAQKARKGKSKQSTKEGK